MLRAATAWGVAQGLLQSDLGKGTRAIRQPSREVKAWSPVEVQALLEACKTDGLGSLFLLLAFLGLRRGEALALRWSDYDSEARTLSISRARVKAWDVVVEGPTKTARSVRTVPVPDPVARVLDLHQMTQRREIEHLSSLGLRTEADYVFLSPYGKPWNPDAVSKHFHRLADRSGFPGRHLHELRHLAASLLLAESVPMPVISRILGHSSTAVTDKVYAHLATDALRDALEASARRLSTGNLRTSSADDISPGH